MARYTLILFLLALSFNVRAEIADGSPTAGSNTESYWDVSTRLSSREESGENVVCSYEPKSPVDGGGEAAVLKECQLFNASREAFHGGNANKLCMVEKIQCFNQSMGFFEMHNLKFYISKDQSCKDVNPADAFKQHDDFSSNVVFIEGH